jgi:hypothetical protein
MTIRLPEAAVAISQYLSYIVVPWLHSVCVVTVTTRLAFDLHCAVVDCSSYCNFHKMAPEVFDLAQVPITSHAFSADRSRKSAHAVLQHRSYVSASQRSL